MPFQAAMPSPAANTTAIERITLRSFFMTAPPLVTVGPRRATPMDVGQQDF